MASLVAFGGTVAADADPRPSPDAGEKPNRNVPTTQVDPLPCDWPGQNSVAPTGDWIAHSAGWGTPSGGAFDTRAELVEFLNSHTSTFVINGESFVLDEAGEWDIHGTAAEFRYITPPKKPQVYEFSWDAVWDDGTRILPHVFPTSQDIHIVEGKDADKDCIDSE